MSVALDSSDLLKWKGTDVKQERIPVGCVPPAFYRTGGGLPYREPPPETPTPPPHSHPWTETSFAGGNNNFHQN